jgi:ligand-binding sensor domain-containing protein
MRTLALVLTLGFLSTTPAAALNPTRPMSEYMLDFWQEDSGLPQKHVFVIHQTRDGYLWLGTRGGLARFDGVRFTVYDDRQPNQLEESEVMDLAEGAEGSLWIATHGGGLSRLKDGAFTTFNAEDGLVSDFLTAVAVAPDGSVWVGSNMGVSHLKDGKATSYRRPQGMPEEDIKSIFVDAKGVTWVGGAAALVSIKDGRVTSFRDALPARRTYLKEIIGDGEGGLWLATGAGLLRFKDGVCTVIQATEETVRGVSRDPQGTIWFATDSTVYRSRGGVVESYSTRVSAVSADRTARAFTLSTINAVFADHEGSIWLGMMKYGIARFRDAVFTTVLPETEEGREVEVSAVFGDSHGGLWFSYTPGRGMARVENGVVQQVPIDSEGTIDTFFEDRAGTVWAVDRNALFKYEAGRFIKKPVANLPSPIASIVSPNGDIWFGDRERGLFQHRGEQVTYYGRDQGLPGHSIRALAQDSKGTIWVGTKSAGLARLQDGKFTVYGKKEGLPSLSMAALYIDRDDTIWGATRRGLTRVRDGRIFVYRASHGLPANFFYQIVEDDLGYLWLTHGRGIVRLSRQELNDVADGKAATVSARIFGTESGMKSTAMVLPNQPVATTTRDGRLWFATGNGVAVVDPASLVQNHVMPPVWIEDVQVDEKSYPIATDVVAPPGEGDLQIQYTGLSFVAPRNVQFKYKLEGFDTDWIDAGTRRIAYYTKLPPASYTFRVKASNNDGVWNETGHSVRFRLRPHWYQTRWFHAGMVLAVGLGLLTLHRVRVETHKRSERELKVRVDEAVSHLKLLRGMLPICASCKKIRDDSGYWNQMETYIAQHSQADFSHGICPECIGKLYPDYAAATGQTPGDS